MALGWFDARTKATSYSPRVHFYATVPVHVGCHAVLHGLSDTARKHLLAAFQVALLSGAEAPLSFVVKLRRLVGLHVRGRVVKPFVEKVQILFIRPNCARNCRRDRGGRCSGVGVSQILPNFLHALREPCLPARLALQVLRNNVVAVRSRSDAVEGLLAVTVPRATRGTEGQRAGDVSLYGRQH
jgi:hypothetical protein